MQLLTKTSLAANLRPSNVQNLFMTTLRALLGVQVLLLGTALSVVNADNVIKETYATVDLTNSTFNTILGKLSPDTPALIEYFASWCPHCRYVHEYPHTPTAGMVHRTAHEAPCGHLAHVGMLGLTSEERTA